MNRTRAWRPIPAALLLVLAFANWSAPTGAARLGDEERAAPASLLSGASGDPAGGPLSGGAAVDGPGPRFGFGSVLGQALATSVTKVATSIDGVPVADPKNVTVRAGQEITFRITGQVQSSAGADVADIFDSSLTYLFDTGQCFPGTLAEIGGNPPLRPANIGGVLVCSPILFGANRAFDFIVAFEVSTAGPRTEPNFNVACAENNFTDVFTLCSSVAGTIASATPTATPTGTSTITPTRTSTPTSTAQPTSTSTPSPTNTAVPLTATPTTTAPPGSGTLVVCKSIVFTGPAGLNPALNPLSATATTFTFTTPSGGPTIPSITVPAGQSGPVCTAGVTVAPGTVAITEQVPTGFVLASVTGGTLAGNTATATIVSGQTTTVTFTNDPTAVVVIPNPPPLLPPPPLALLPPPPPPLLPPPPLPAPLGAAAAGQSPLASVPVIPEADSLALLVGGLGALGLVAAWRARRRDFDRH